MHTLSKQEQGEASTANKNTHSGASKKTTESNPGPAKLHRTTFCTSRLLEYLGEDELTKQTGHARDEWHLVFVKELTDNALDACEAADIDPVICVAADATGISVQDNGPGLPEETLNGAMDFAVRVSNRAGYVAPDRGR